jgi:ribosomal protein S18 acetylase RimI-like enzyme
MAAFRLDSPAAVGRHLDVLLADAWPPLEEERDGGWRFRWTAGLTGRANSALPIDGEDRLDALVARAETFYTGRQAPARFLVSEASAPAGLTSTLASRGYRPEKSTVLMIATSTSVSRRLGAARPDVRISAVIDDAWFEAYWAVESERGRSDSDRDIYRRILLAPDRPQLLAALWAGDKVVSTAQGVLDGDWCGVQCVATRTSHRGQGAATAVLGALADATGDAGAPHLYLAVQADNQHAISLYERAGFRRSHRYEYWVDRSDTTG